MSKKKLLISFVIFIFLILITFYSVFSITTLDVFIENLKKIKFIYWIICILLSACYFLFQGIFTKLIFKSLNSDINIFKCIYYSLVEFFFSGITPSSTGGQPVQLYFMTKDKIPMRKSLIVLILGTIYFKLFFVFFGVIILVFRSDLIFSSNYIKLLYLLGLLVDIIMILIGYMLIYNQKMIRKILNFIYKVRSKFNKKNDEIEIKIEETLKNYQRQTIYMKNHRLEVIFGLIITFIQRIFMFSIAYVLYKAFGFAEYSYIELLFIQIASSIAAEAIPLPGGTGISEPIIKNLYINLFTFSLASTGMILTRLFSFYLPLLIICLIIIIVTKISYCDK